MPDMMAFDKRRPRRGWAVDAGSVATEATMKYLLSALFSFLASGIGEDPPTDPSPNMGPAIDPGI